MSNTVFIGSSSETLPDVDDIAVALEELGATVIRWNDPDHFPAADATIDSLLRLSETVDAALFVFAPDDAVDVRGASGRQPRDNVLLEYGMFLARLGKRNVSIYLKGDARIPEDVKGVTDIRTRDRFNNQARAQLKAWFEGLRWKDTNGALEAWLLPAIQVRQTFRERVVTNAQGARKRSRQSVEGPLLIDVNSAGLSFFGVADRDQYLFRETTSLMDLLKKFVNPPDQYWQDLVEDQVEVYQKFLAGETALANVAIRLNEAHPSFAGRIFVPFIVQRQATLQADGLLREDSTAVYLDISRLPRHVFGEQIWKDVSRDIDLQALASDFDGMSATMEAHARRLQSLREAAASLRNGGGPRVLELCAEVGLYSILRAAGKSSVAESFLWRLGVNRAPADGPPETSGG
jgi:Predicted nucleotide-binding protein containing TIR-like domain